MLFFRQLIVVALLTLQSSVIALAQSRENGLLLPEDTTAVFSLDVKALMSVSPAHMTVGKELSKLIGSNPIVDLWVRKLKFNPAVDLARVTVAVAGSEPATITLLYGKFDVETINKHYPRLVKAQVGGDFVAENIDGITVHSFVKNTIDNRTSHENVLAAVEGSHCFCALSAELIAFSTDKHRMKSLIANYRDVKSNQKWNGSIETLIRKVDHSQVGWFAFTSEYSERLIRTQEIKMPGTRVRGYGHIKLKDGITVDVTLEDVDESAAIDLVDQIDVQFAVSKQMGAQQILIGVVLGEGLIVQFAGRSLIDFLGISRDRDILFAQITDFVNNIDLTTDVTDSILTIKLALPWKQR